MTTARFWQFSVLAILIAIYVVGFCAWALPVRNLAEFGPPPDETCYYFERTPTNHLLSILYAPVFWIERANVGWYSIGELTL